MKMAVFWVTAIILQNISWMLKMATLEGKPASTVHESKYVKKDDFIAGQLVWDEVGMSLKPTYWTK
jgi:hypothetical protein